MDHAEGVLLPALHGPHTSIHRTYDSQVGETQVQATGCPTVSVSTLFAYNSVIC